MKPIEPLNTVFMVDKMDGDAIGIIKQFTELYEELRVGHNALQAEVERIDSFLIDLNNLEADRHNPSTKCKQACNPCSFNRHNECIYQPDDNFGCHCKLQKIINNSIGTDCKQTTGLVSFQDKDVNKPDQPYSNITIIMDGNSYVPTEWLAEQIKRIYSEPRREEL